MAGAPAYLAAQDAAGDRPAGMRVLSTCLTLPDETTRAVLNLGPDDPVVDIRRVRVAGGAPISLEHAQFPAALVPGLLDTQLGGSITEILRVRFDVVTGEVDERIEAVNATPTEATLLGVKPKSALLLITRVVRDSHGVIYEFSRDLVNGDTTCLAVRTNGGSDVALVTRLT